MKLRAIDNLHEAGVDIVPVTTIVNGINNDQVGSDHPVRARQSEEDRFLSFQPVSFTGRDEESPRAPAAQRYTLSHLAHDVKNQVRHQRADARLVPALVHGHVRRLGRPRSRADGRVGPVSLRLPPELRRRHGVMVDKETKEAVPVTAFLNAGQVAKDMRKINDAARGQVDVDAR